MNEQRKEYSITASLLRGRRPPRASERIKEGISQTSNCDDETKTELSSLGYILM